MANLQKNKKLKINYNRLLSNCSWLENEKGPATRPSTQDQIKVDGNVRRKLH